MLGLISLLVNVICKEKYLYNCSKIVNIQKKQCSVVLRVFEGAIQLVHVPIQ